jgi:transcriptional regulator with XRE-family HTH domain
LECNKKSTYQIDRKKVKIARIERDWTIETLSKVSQVTRKTISEIERGKKKRIRFATMARIAAALEMEVDLFFTQNESLEN